MLQEDFTQETVSQKIITVALDGWRGYILLEHSLWHSAGALSCQLNSLCIIIGTWKEGKWNLKLSHFAWVNVQMSTEPLSLLSENIQPRSCKNTVSTLILINPNVFRQYVCKKIKPQNIKTQDRNLEAIYLQNDQVKF